MNPRTPPTEADHAATVRVALDRLAVHEHGEQYPERDAALAALDALVAERDEAREAAESAEAERLAYAKASLDQLDHHRAELDIVIETRKKYVTGWKERAEAAEAERDAALADVETVGEDLDHYRLLCIETEAERDRYKAALTDLLELHEDEPDRPAVRLARAALAEGQT